MGYIEGLLGGFLNRKYDVEAENRRQGELAANHERSIFTTLLSSPDEEVRNLAVSGLLDSANPRQKAGGLRGWVGQTLASPYLARIQALSPTVRTEEQVQGETLPSRQMHAGATLPNVQPSILPSEDRSYEQGDPAAAIEQPSPVQPGAPPPTPVSYTQSPPTPSTFTRIAYRPRQVLMSPEQAAFSKAIAEARAEPAGMYAGLQAAGFGDTEAREIVKAHLSSRYGASGAFGQSISGEAPDETGAFKPTFGVFNKVANTYVYPGTTTPIPGFRPRTSTASTSMGVTLEPLARAMFNGPFVGLTQPQQQQVLAMADQRKNILTVKDAIAAAQRFLPNTTVDQQMALADALMSGTQAPVTAPGGPPAVQATPPTAAPTAPTTAPSSAPPATATPTTPPGAPPKLSTIVPPDIGGGSKETGKPLPPAIARTVAQAKATNDLIDKAMAALEPFKADTSLQGSLNLVKQYRQGVYDPVAGAAAQLADLAGLQSSAQASLTSGGTRAYQFYIDRRQHVPKLPSIRQVQANKLLPADAVQGISGLLRDDAGTFDSPQQMYEKLVRAKENNRRFVEELEAASLQTKPMPSHGPASTPKTHYDPVTKQWIIE